MYVFIIFVSSSSMYVRARLTRISCRLIVQIFLLSPLGELEDSHLKEDLRISGRGVSSRKERGNEREQKKRRSREQPLTGSIFSSKS